MTLLAIIFFIGVGATAIMDLWGWLRQRVFGGKGLDYGLVGRWIAHMPHGRFRHDNIAAMFGADGRPRIERQQLLEKADELDQSIKQLTAMRDGLRHAAACSAPSHLECPRFRSLMGLAGAGVIGERRNGASGKK